MANGYAEQLMRTIKEEEVDLSEYASSTDVYQQIEQLLDEIDMEKGNIFVTEFANTIEIESQNDKSTYRIWLTRCLSSGRISFSIAKLTALVEPGTAKMSFA